MNLKQLVIPRVALEAVPLQSASFYKIIPLALEDGVLRVGMVDPSDVPALEALKFIGQHRGLKTRIEQVSPGDFNKALKQYGGLKEEVGEALADLETELQADKTRTGVDLASVDSAKIGRLSQEAPITKVVAVILRHSVDGGASDIHIEPKEDEVQVRFRVDGILHSSLILPQKIHSAIASRIKILSNLKIDETRKPQDGRFQAKVNNRKIDFRVSTFPTAYGEKIVMRILDTASGVLSLDDLGL
jgi:type IV pilus assembly protein PilB